jgi:hypothetical protein
VLVKGQEARGYDGPVTDAVVGTIMGTLAMFHWVRKSRLAGWTLPLVACILGVHAAKAATALQMFSDSRQAISPVAITEDDQGFLWIAADQGVFQFDGNHFIKIPGEFDVPAGIATIGKRSVLVACSNGVFQYSDGVTRKLTAESANTLVKLSEDIVLVLHSRIDLTRTPILWAATAVLVGNKVQLRSLDGIAGWVWQSIDGRLSFACGSHPCFLQNSEPFREAIRASRSADYIREHTKTALKVEIPQPVIKTIGPVSPIATDSFGNYFFRPAFSGLVSVRHSRGNGTDYNVGEFTRANGRALLYPGRSGRVWIPGDYLYVSSGGTVSKFIVPELDAIRVNCVYEDSNGRTWFGLAEKGLAAMGIGPIAEAWSTPAALGEISSIVRGSPSRLYATTSKGAILQRQGNEDWNPISLGEDDPKIVHLAPGDHGTLFGLTGIGPPVRLAANGRVLEQLRPLAEMMLSSLRPLLRAPDGTYIVGSIQFPPCLYRIKGNRIESISVQGPSGDVHDIVADSQGRVWVGYGDGVCRIENTTCKTAISEADGLLDSTPQSVGVGPLDEIWIAYRSAKAFSRFRLVNGRWAPRHFFEKDGYQSARNEFFRRDRRGWVWRGTSQGLFVSDGVHVEAGDWLWISERDGLPSENVNRFGFLEDTDGSVWVGTARGIAHLYPSPSWFKAKGGSITSIAYQEKKFLAAGTFPGVFMGPGEFSATIGAAGLFPVRSRLSPSDRSWRTSYVGDIPPQQLGPGQYDLEVIAGMEQPAVHYRFQIVPTVGAKLRMAGLIGLPPALLAAFGVFLWRRKIHEAKLPPLPDLSEARLAILSPDLDGLIGKTLGDRFLPRRLLARGGFGTVFEGCDLQTSIRCAIKVFRREFGGGDLTRQFQQEIAALEAVQHPNIVRLLGHGITPAGSTFLVMEYIEGSTLRELLNHGPIPQATCARFLRQIGCALHAIHSRNIFHRDLKPENLMIRNSAGASADVVLIDFSMAIVKDPDRSLFGLSRAGGTVHYMAPEQALGHASAEGDIYSLGKLVIEMLTGRRIHDLLPEATLDLSERVQPFLRTQPFGLSVLSIDILASSLEFDPTRRVHSVQAFIEPIARDLEASSTVERPNLPGAIVLPSPIDDGLAENSAS